MTRIDSLLLNQGEVIFGYYIVINCLGYEIVPYPDLCQFAVD